MSEQNDGQIQLAVPNVKLVWNRSAFRTSAYAADVSVTYPPTTSGTYRLFIDRTGPGKWSLRVWKDGAYFTGCPGKTLKALKAVAEDVIVSALRGKS